MLRLFIQHVLAVLRLRLATLRDRLTPAFVAARRMPMRTAVLAGVLIIAVPTVIFLRARMGPEDAAPADRFLEFRCRDCGTRFALSHRQFEALWNRGSFTHDGRTGQLLIRCTHCGHQAAARFEHAASPPTTAPESTDRPADHPRLAAGLARPPNIE
jgi:hypothetical protein